MATTVKQGVVYEISAENKSKAGVDEAVGYAKKANKSLAEEAANTANSAAASFSPVKLLTATLSGNVVALANQFVALAAKIKLVALSAAAFTGIVAVIGAVASAAMALWNHYKDLEEEERKLKDEQLDKYLKRAASAQKELEEATKRSTAAFEKQLEAVKKVDECAQRIQKLNLDAQRSRDLAAANPEDRDAINARYDDLQSAADWNAKRDEAARNIRKLSFLRDQAWGNASNMGFTVGRLRSDIAHMDGTSYEKYAESKSKLEEAEQKKFEYERTARELQHDIDEAQKDVALIDAEEAAAADKRLADRELKAREEAEKAAQEEYDAEVKAQEDLEAERERLDEEWRRSQEEAERNAAAERLQIFRKELADQRAELAAYQADQKDAESRLASAQQASSQAWGWYRNQDSLAGQLQEERANAEAEKQYERDFAKLKSRRSDWRTADDYGTGSMRELSLSDTAVKRVALAREEEKAAQKAAEETAENTRLAAEHLAEIEALLQE